MKDLLRIAIVDPSDTTREQLRNVLLGLEQIWLEAECSRYEFFFDVIEQSRPDVAMISLDSDQNKALALIQEVNARDRDLPILAVSNRGDGQVILQALRVGAKEFITTPIVMEELLAALQRLRRDKPSIKTSTGEPTPVRKESQVIAVLGSRGGVGCTTLGVNLGATLAQHSQHSVALIDLDLALGDADVLLDLVGDYTLADVALNVDRLDMQFLRRSLCKHSSGLSLLSHPVQIADVGMIREDHLTRVIGLLRASYTHLILDLSKSFGPADITAMQMADVILLVAQLELSSLRNVVRILMALDHESNLSSKVKIVINRIGIENEIPIKQAEKTIEKAVAWQIPNDVRVIDEARNEGRPLVQSAPRNKVQQAIYTIAEALCGKPLRNNGKETSRGWSLFSLG